MKVVSVNVGKPQSITWKGQTVESGIIKTPVSGRVSVSSTNLDGDGQADLKSHGGENKAVYCFSSEHYGFWMETIPESELGWGAFGENLTLMGLVEEDVHVGDRFEVGSCEFEVTQHRTPCYKLNIKFRRNDVQKKFWKSCRFGFYVKVLREGEVGAGDEITFTLRAKGVPTVAEIIRGHVENIMSPSARLKRVLRHPLRTISKLFARLLKE